MEAELQLACRDMLSMRPLEQKSVASRKPAFRYCSLRKTIKTDFSELKLFLLAFIDYMVDQLPEPDLRRVLRNLNAPLGFSSKELLRFLLREAPP